MILKGDIMRLADQHASRVRAHFFVIPIFALTAFVSAQAFAREGFRNGRQTVPVPSTSVVAPVPLKPGYLQLVARCTYLPQAATAEGRRNLMNGLLAGTEITPAEQITQTLSNCLDRAEEALKRPEAPSRLGVTSLKPYFDDLAARRAASALEASRILAMLDPREVAREIVAKCDVESILDKGGGDFEAEGYIAGQSNHSSDVIQANYAAIVADRCYGPIMRVIDAMPVSPATQAAIETVRQGLTEIKPRVSKWLKAKH